MIIAQLNTTYLEGSTGNICSQICSQLNERKIENYVLYSKRNRLIKDKKAICYSNGFEIFIGKLFSHIIGSWGTEGLIPTIRLIRYLKKINPNIIHIHNIHSHACNIELLFNYILKKHIRVVWTFHDCWAFTGNCVHYDSINCKKWKNNCGNCPKNRKYSFLFDRTSYSLSKKREIFSKVKMTIVCPSKWMYSQVCLSFLGNMKKVIISNGIDLSVFRPIKSNFRERYNCIGKKIVLGVSSSWNYEKGLDIFIELSKALDGNAQIVLVGTNNKIDSILPNNIISIHNTSNKYELAEIYSSVDVFLNPTREDTFPTVNMEAISCHTPVVTSNIGGSPEIVDNGCGYIVNGHSISDIVDNIEKVFKNTSYLKKNCGMKSLYFDKKETYRRYIDLYNEISFY